MILQDLISAADVDEIIHIFDERRNFALDDKRELSQVRASYKKRIAELAACKVEPSDYIIVPVMYIEYNRSYLCASLFAIEDVTSFEPNLADEELEELSSAAPGMGIDELREALDRLDHPEGYSYVFSPWEEILGCEVFLGEVGDEAIAAIAEDAIWELTFFGSDREERAARVAETVESLEAAVRDIEDGNYVSYEEMKEELYEKFGHRDERTEQEKEEARRQIFVSTVLNAISSSRTIVKCADALRR